MGSLDFESVYWTWGENGWWGGKPIASKQTIPIAQILLILGSILPNNKKPLPIGHAAAADEWKNFSMVVRKCPGDRSCFCLHSSPNRVLYNKLYSETHPIYSLSLALTHPPNENNNNNSNCPPSYQLLVEPPPPVPVCQHTAIKMMTQSPKITQNI